MRGSLSGGGGVPMAPTHSRRFRSAKYRLEMGGASSVVSVFQAFGNSFVGKVRAFARMPTLATIKPSLRWGTPMVVRSDVGHPFAQTHYDCKVRPQITRNLLQYVAANRSQQA